MNCSTMVLHLLFRGGAAVYLDAKFDYKKERHVEPADVMKKAKEIGSAIYATNTIESHPVKVSLLKIDTTKLILRPFTINDDNPIDSAIANGGLLKIS